MSNVQKLPRFKSGEVVDLYSDPQVLEENRCTGDSIFITKALVKARYSAEPLGWVYRLEGVSGLMEEHCLRRHDAGNEPVLNGRTHYLVTTPEAVLQAMQGRKFQPGQIARTVEADDVEMDEELRGILVLIVGHVYYDQELFYICALRHESGKFIDAQEEFYEDELEALSNEELASITGSGVRPKLTVVRNT